MCVFISGGKCYLKKQKNFQFLLEEVKHPARCDSNSSCWRYIVCGMYYHIIASLQWPLSALIHSVVCVIPKWHYYLSVKHKNEKLKLPITHHRLWHIFLIFYYALSLIYNSVHLGHLSPRHIQKVREVRTSRHVE